MPVRLDGWTALELGHDRVRSGERRSGRRCRGRVDRPGPRPASPARSLRRRARTGTSRSGGRDRLRQTGPVRHARGGRPDREPVGIGRLPRPVGRDRPRSARHVGRIRLFVASTPTDRRRTRSWTRATTGDPGTALHVQWGHNRQRGARVHAGRRGRTSVTSASNDGERLLGRVEEKSSSTRCRAGHP